MDVNEIKDWGFLASTGLSIGAIVYAWLTARAKGNSEAISEVKKDLKEHDRRIQSVEADIRQMPDKDAVHDMDIKITELNGALKAVVQSLGSVERTAQRIEKFLLDHGKAG